MRLRLAILVICAFALLAAPARADHGATVNDPTLARYMAIAAAYWGGPEPVCTTQDGEVIHPHAVLADNPQPEVAAWAEVGGCRIWLDIDFWPAPADERYCNLIAHEWGHLLGYGHSSDSQSLMWPQWTNDVVPGCQVFRPPPRPASPVQRSSPKIKRYRAGKLQGKRRLCASRARHTRGSHKRAAIRQSRRRACLRRLKKRRAASSSRLRLSPGMLLPDASGHTAFLVPLTIALPESEH
jgi:Matrixin